MLAVDPLEPVTAVDDFLLGPEQVLLIKMQKTLLAPLLVPYCFENDFKGEHNVFRILEVVTSIRQGQVFLADRPLIEDMNRYIDSYPSFSRVMRERGLLTHRGRSKPEKRKKPEPLIARCPNQIYSLDINYLLSPVAGQFFYLYLAMDIFNSKIVGFRIEEREYS